MFIVSISNSCPYIKDFYFVFQMELEIILHILDRCIRYYAPNHKLLLDMINNLKCISKIKKDKY